MLADTPVADGAPPRTDADGVGLALRLGLTLGFAVVPTTERRFGHMTVLAAFRASGLSV
jgi:hypothetical protein